MSDSTRPLGVQRTGREGHPEELSQGGRDRPDQGNRRLQREEARRPNGREARAARALWAVALIAFVLSLALVSCGGEKEQSASVEVTYDVPYAGPNGPAFDVYRSAATGEASPAVIVLHGGAWRAGSKGDATPIAEKYARAGFIAFAVDYTLVDEGLPGYPLQLRELQRAVRAIRSDAERFGVDPARIGATGSSAGAHLAALLATTGSGPLTDGDRVGALVAWSAPIELTADVFAESPDHEVANFLGCGDCPDLAVAASPVTHVSPDDPPTMVVNSAEELIPVEQARLFDRRLRAAGVTARLLILPGDQHAPDYEAEAIGPSIAFMREQLGAIPATRG